MKRTLMVCLTLALSGVAGAQVADNAAIEKILTERIDAQHQGVGIVVGVVDAQGRRTTAHGVMEKGGAPVDGRTVFEIGSVTKVFTSLLLADMAARGEVALDDPVAKYLPPSVKMPQRGGQQITLRQLAMHTSGLPRLPKNLQPKNGANPYADYTAAQLYEFLSSYELPRDIGTEYEYSNLGGGLLGHVLARRAATDYESLVRSRVLNPLGMKDTSITLSSDMKRRLAVGHDPQLKPVPNWDFDALAGAGALRSTADDLLTFLAANLGFVETPLSKPMSAMLASRHGTSASTPDVEIALGWHVSKRNEREIVWHNGGTGGYRSFIGFDPKRGTGVVVLANTFTPAGVDDIGMHLLDPKTPLAVAPASRKEIAVDAKHLDRLTGQYELAPNFTLTVTADDGQLYAQATGQGTLPIFPKSEREFFYKAVDAQLTFDIDSEGPAKSVTLHQNGANVKGRRIGGVPEQPKTIAVKPDTLQKYVGRYPLAPTFVLTVTLEDGQLYVQATGQPKLPVFAKGEREFFYKVVDAQITFNVDDKGKVTGLVLHQNGRDMPAQRAE